MCVNNIKSPLQNAPTKIAHTYTGPSDSNLYADMASCDQNGKLVAHSTKMYPNDDCTFFQVCFFISLFQQNFAFYSSFIHLVYYFRY